MATVITVVGVTKLIYEVLERDYGVPTPGGTGTGTGGGGNLTVTSGLSAAQVQSLIDTAIAGIPAGGGVSQAQVDAAIAAAVAALPPAGISLAQAEAAITTALGALPVPLAVGDVQTLINDAIAAIPAPVPGLTAEQVDEIVQTAIAEIPPGGLDEAAVVAVIERKLTEFGPALQEAIASQVGRVTDRLTLNSSVAGDGPVVIETNNLTGAQHKVGINFVTQRDGEITINDKRVLTVDDAIDPTGVDAAAVEAAVAPLAAELAKKADKTALDQLSTDLGDSLSAVQQEYTQLTNDVVEYVIADYATKAALQALMDAMSGPDATPESIKDMFTNLNDAIAQMVDEAFNDKAPGLVQAISDYLSLTLGLLIPSNAASKEDVAAAKEDILKSISGGKVVTDKPWTTCPPASTGAGINSTGWLSARVLNGIVTLRGDILLNNPLPTTDGWVTIRNLPEGFPPPDFVVASAINGYVGGTRYVPAGIRVTNDGSLQVIATSEATKGFNFTGLMYQAF